MKAFEFKPKLFTTLQNYSKESFMADLMAGIIVGIEMCIRDSCSLPGKARNVINTA